MTRTRPAAHLTALAVVLTLPLVLAPAATAAPAWVATDGRAAPPATPADGPTEQMCSELRRGPHGVVLDARIPAGLVADGNCRLESARIYGGILVPPGSTLDLVWGNDVHGDLRVTGTALLQSAVVHGDVVLDGAPRLEVQSSNIAGSVTGTTASARFSDSAVAGDVALTTTDATRLRRGLVGGTVDLRGGRHLVHDMGVLGGFSSTSATDLLVCRTSVGADLAVTDVQGWSRVGHEGPNVCRTTVGGSVRVLDNPHTVVLDDLVVAGDLVCTGNTGPRLVEQLPRVTVTGARTGQCA